MVAGELLGDTPVGVVVRLLWKVADSTVRRAVCTVSDDSVVSAEPGLAGEAVDTSVSPGVRGLCVGPVLCAESGLPAKAVEEKGKMVVWELPEGVAVLAVGDPRADAVHPPPRPVVCGLSVDSAVAELSAVAIDPTDCAVL